MWETNLQCSILDFIRHQTLLPTVRCAWLRMSWPRFVFPLGVHILKVLDVISHDVSLICIKKQKPDDWWNSDKKSTGGTCVYQGHHPTSTGHADLKPVILFFTNADDLCLHSEVSHQDAVVYIKAHPSSVKIHSIHRITLNQLRSLQCSAPSIACAIFFPWESRSVVGRADSHRPIRSRVSNRFGALRADASSRFTRFWKYL